MVAINVLRRPEPTSVARYQRASFDTLLVKRGFVKKKMRDTLGLPEICGRNPKFSFSVHGESRQNASPSTAPWRHDDFARDGNFPDEVHLFFMAKGSVPGVYSGDFGK